MKILVADDELGVRRHVAGQLRALGHRVNEAADGMEAYEKLGVGNFELLVADYRMPFYTGIDLLRRLRRQQNSKMPVIVYSSNEKIRYDITDLGGIYVNKQHCIDNLIQAVTAIAK